MRSLPATPQKLPSVCSEPPAEAPMMAANSLAYQGKLRAVLRVIFFFISALQQIVVVMAASTASAVGWPCSERR